MVGTWLSLTVIVKLAVAPELAVATTVVVPFGKAEPDAWLRVMAPQAPELVGAAKFTIAEHRPGSLLTVIFAGTVIMHVWQTPPPGTGAARSPDTVTE